MSWDWLNAALKALAQAIITPDLFWSLLGTMGLMHIIKIASLRFANPMLRQEIYLWSVFVAYPVVHKIYGMAVPIPVWVLSIIIGVAGNIIYAWAIGKPMRRFAPDLYETLNGGRRKQDVAVTQERRKP